MFKYSSSTASDNTSQVGWLVGWVSHLYEPFMAMHAAQDAKVLATI